MSKPKAETSKWNNEVHESLIAAIMDAVNPTRAQLDEALANLNKAGYAFTWEALRYVKFHVSLFRFAFQHWGVGVCAA